MTPDEPREGTPGERRDAEPTEIVDIGAGAEPGDRPPGSPGSAEPSDRPPAESESAEPPAAPEAPDNDAPPTTVIPVVSRAESPWSQQGRADQGWGSSPDAPAEVFRDAGDVTAPPPPPPAPPAPAPAQQPPPALVATALSLESTRGPIFRDVTLTVHAGTIAAIVGRAGTGRSSVLLGLTGRMTGTAGAVSVAGHSFAQEPAVVRALSSVARIGTKIGPEPGLTVDECVRERCLIENVAIPDGRQRFRQACEALGLDVATSVLAGDLRGEDATLLAVALAAIPISAVIVLDDLDRGIDGSTERSLLDALDRLAATGPAIVFTTTDRRRVSDVPVIVELPVLTVRPPAPPEPPSPPTPALAPAVVDAAPPALESTGAPDARFAPPGDPGQAGPASAEDDAPTTVISREDPR